MFLLRRRKDGKYWNNSGNRHGDRWVDDPSICKPFKSINAIRHSRACYGCHPDLGRPAYNDRDPQVWKDYTIRSATWFAPSNAQARKDYFDTQYEAVPCQVKVVQ